MTKQQDKTTVFKTKLQSSVFVFQADKTENYVKFDNNQGLEL
jgi:hypothetical protein